MSIERGNVGTLQALLAVPVPAEVEVEQLKTVLWFLVGDLVALQCGGLGMSPSEQANVQIALALLDGWEPRGTP
jgi:Na+/H+-translocating membrane pyrophosphatase